MFGRTLQDTPAHVVLAEVQQSIEQRVVRRDGSLVVGLRHGQHKRLLYRGNERGGIVATPGTAPT